LTKAERIIELLHIISNKSERIKKLKLDCGHQATKICVLNLRNKELEDKVGKCLWTQDEDGIYDTDCDNRFELLEGIPKDNKMMYCPYCGLHIAQAWKG